MKISEEEINDKICRMIGPDEKLLSADEVKATLSPHMKSVWDAAVKCLYASTDENLAEFKKLCRPAEIMVLLRAYADSVIPETNNK